MFPVKWAQIFDSTTRRVVLQIQAKDLFEKILSFEKIITAFECCRIESIVNIIATSVKYNQIFHEMFSKVEESVETRFHTKLRAHVAVT